MTVRRVIPWLVLPLAVLAGGLASAPWLRAFPAATIAVPLFGAAVLSVLVPLLVVRLLTRSLWLSALVDVVAFLAYTLLLVLREPTGFTDLFDGFRHGPAQLLSFALPLVSPPSLLVAPVALCWLAGTVAGEALSRARSSLIPYASWLVTFGLAYAGTARAAPAGNHTARTAEILLAAGLLGTLAMLRSAQAWLSQDSAARSSQADSVLPLRGLALGTVVTLLVAAGASSAVRTPAFSGRAVAPQRVPSVDQAAPVTPIAFIAALRTQPGKPTQRLFDLSLDATSPAYVSIASLDFYDGDSWSFNRLFRPSGGVVPADLDHALDPKDPSVSQRYRIRNGPLTAGPWMPYMNRPSKVSGEAISVDQDSGMIVPTRPVHAGDSYGVRSAVSAKTFTQLAGTPFPATSPPPIDTQVPAELRVTLTKVIAAFATETGQSSSSPVPFLQALAAELRSRYSLAGAAGSSSSPDAGSSSGTSFSEVLASIIGAQRTATPEQFATMYALIARQLGVPARVITGFHLDAASGAATVPAGQYGVTTAAAATWVELPIRGAGWVVVDPSPSRLSNGRQSQKVGAAPSNTPSSLPSQNALITDNSGGHAVAPRSKTAQPRREHPSPLPVIGLVVVGSLALLAFVLLVLLTRKRRRRSRRRRTADPRARLIGAWQESIDVLTESGLDDLTTLTNAEITCAAGTRFGAESAVKAAELGRAANAASYSSTVAISDDDADAAWTAHASLRKLVRKQLPVRERVITTLRYNRVRSRRGEPGAASWAARAAAPVTEKRRTDRLR